MEEHLRPVISLDVCSGHAYEVRHNRLERLLAVGSWHLSRMVIPDFEVKEALAIRRHQLLFILYATQLPIPISEITPWTIQIYLQTTRLAFSIGYDSGAEHYLFHTVGRTADPTVPMRCASERQRWVEDQLTQAWNLKQGVARDSDSFKPMLIFRDDQSLQYDFSAVLEAWAEWRGFQNVPEVRITPSSDPEVAGMD